MISGPCLLNFVCFGRINGTMADSNARARVLLSPPLSLFRKKPSLSVWPRLKESQHWRRVVKKEEGHKFGQIVCLYCRPTHSVDCSLKQYQPFIVVCAPQEADADVCRTTLAVRPSPLVLCRGSPFFSELCLFLTGGSSAGQVQMKKYLAFFPGECSNPGFWKDYCVAAAPPGCLRLGIHSTR